MKERLIDIAFDLRRYRRLHSPGAPSSFRLPFLPRLSVSIRHDVGECQIESVPLVFVFLAGGFRFEF